MTKNEIKDYIKDTLPWLDVLIEQYTSDSTLNVIWVDLGEIPSEIPDDPTNLHDDIQMKFEREVNTALDNEDYLYSIRPIIDRCVDVFMPGATVKRDVIGFVTTYDYNIFLIIAFCSRSPSNGMIPYNELFNISLAITCAYESISRRRVTLLESFMNILDEINDEEEDD